MVLINCPEPKKQNPVPLIGLLLNSRGSGGSGTGTGLGTGSGIPTDTGTGTGTSSTPSISDFSSSTEVVGGTSFNVGNVTVSGGNFTTGTFKIVMSIDSTLDNTDTEVGTITGVSTYDVNVPASLVPSSASLPVKYFYGLIPRQSNTTTSSIIVFPTNSLLRTSTTGTLSPTSLTLTATNTQAFIRYFIALGSTKLTASAYQVTGGLNPDLGLIQQSNLTLISNITKNDNGADMFEFASYNLSLVASTSFYIRVRSVGGTVGTFKPAIFTNRNGNIDLPNPFGVVSCTGGTGNFINSRCVTYSTTDFSVPATNNADCSALQGMGSTWANSACTSTNRVARCFANPLFNRGYGIINFYTPETTGTADTLCGGDILTTP